LVYHDDGTLNKKSAILGRERQYITATFKYKNSYVGLLELENDASASVSTWVISSKGPVTESIFQKFTTKNHEKNGESSRWIAGVLGKV
jgi:hypothetical protein